MIYFHDLHIFDNNQLNIDDMCDFFMEFFTILLDKHVSKRKISNRKYLGSTQKL